MYPVLVAVDQLPSPLRYEYPTAGCVGNTQFVSGFPRPVRLVARALQAGPAM